MRDAIITGLLIRNGNSCKVLDKIKCVNCGSEVDFKDAHLMGSWKTIDPRYSYFCSDCYTMVLRSLYPEGLEE